MHLKQTLFIGRETISVATYGFITIYRFPIYYLLIADLLLLWSPWNEYIRLKRYRYRGSILVQGNFSKRIIHKISNALMLGRDIGRAT